MRIESVPATAAPAAGNRDADRWNVIERRIIVVDGVVVHYEVAQRNARDMNGVNQLYAAVTIRWPMGERTIPTNGFSASMSDEQLRLKVRDAMRAQ